MLTYVQHHIAKCSACPSRAMHFSKKPYEFWKMRYTEHVVSTRFGGPTQLQYVILDCGWCDQWFELAYGERATCSSKKE